MSKKGSANTTIFLIAWKSTSGLEKLSLQCELLFFVEAAANFEFYEISHLLELLSAVGGKAVKEGKARAREAHEEFIAKSFVGGAGMGHRLAKVDSELPPLRLVFKKQK